MTDPILNTHNKEEYAPAHTAEHLQSMTYEEYLKQQQQAIDVRCPRCYLQIVRA